MLSQFVFILKIKIKEAFPLLVTKVQDPPTDRAVSSRKVTQCTNPPPHLREVNTPPLQTRSLSFPVSNFTYFLTLFSKFFLSFPHGTCSLSVSRQYLALDELYHPISAALPSNATL